MTREWTDDEKASWLAAHEQTDLAAAAALVSHVVTYRPDIRIHVLVPPWTNPETWFQEAHQGWNEWLWDPGQHWTDPANEALIEIEVLGSTAQIDPVAHPGDAP